MSTIWVENRCAKGRKVTFACRRNGRTTCGVDRSRTATVPLTLCNWRLPSFGSQPRGSTLLPTESPNKQCKQHLECRFDTGVNISLTYFVAPKKVYLLSLLSRRRLSLLNYFSNCQQVDKSLMNTFWSSTSNCFSVHRWELVNMQSLSAPRWRAKSWRTKKLC